MIKQNETEAKLVATREAYGQELVNLGQKHPELVVLDAGMSNSTYSDVFAKQFPKRYFPMFIAEQNAIGVAVGLAKRGFVPFISTFASFWTRAYDQLRMAGYSSANIKICGSHVGLSAGPDGVSQMGLEDLAMFRSVSGSTVFYPADEVSTIKLMNLAYQTLGLTYLRTTKIPTPVIYDRDTEFEVSGLNILKQTNKDTIAIISAGVTLFEALKAYEELSKQDIKVRIIDLYCLKPLSKKTLNQALSGIKQIVTVEDHYPEGGMAEAVGRALSDNSYQIFSLAVNKMPKSGQFRELLAFEEIDKKAIVDKVKQLL